MLGIRGRQLLVILGVVFVLVMNGLANALPFNGVTTAQISDQFPVYFVPAGYVFAIWGVIYLGLIGYAIYQALPGQRDDAVVRGIDGLFLISALLNSVWLLLWHYQQFALTVVVMVGLLLTLIAIYLRLRVTRRPVSFTERWLLRVPFSIYLGWITVATVANVTDFLYFLRWDGWGLNPVVWGVIMLVVASLLGVAMLLSRRDFAYALVLVWAFVGIAVKQADTPPMVYASLGLALFLSLLSLYATFVRRPTAQALA